MEGKPIIPVAQAYPCQLLDPAKAVVERGAMHVEARRRLLHIPGQVEVTLERRQKLGCPRVVQQIRQAGVERACLKLVDRHLGEHLIDAEIIPAHDLAER